MSVSGNEMQTSRRAQAHRPSYSQGQEREQIVVAKHITSVERRGRQRDLVQVMHNTILEKEQE